MDVGFDVRKYLDQFLKLEGYGKDQFEALYEFDLMNVFKAKLSEEIAKQLAAGVFTLKVEVYILAKESLDYIIELSGTCD